MQTSFSKNLSAKKLLVIKCGGSILNNLAELNELISGVSGLIKRGYAILVVHGGGPDINQFCTALHLESSFIKGLRVTTPAILEVTQMALLGKTNANLVHKFNQHQLPALGLSGHDLSLLTAEFMDRNNLGYVGSITRVNTKFLQELLSMGILPVVAPLAVDGEGNTLNVNADLAASAIASAMQAEKLILLSDIDGYYAAYPDKNSLVAVLSSTQVRALLATPGAVDSGMHPKLTACLDAVNNLVTMAHIVNGNTPQILTAVIGSQVGTTVIKGETK